MRSRRFQIDRGRAFRTFALFGIASGFGAGAWLTACSSSDSATPSDGGLDATGDVAVDGGSDGGPGGHCSAVEGPACDLVLQDCPSGNECIVQDAGAGSFTTGCVAAGTGSLTAGAACCPGVENQCVHGMECVGPPCTGGPVGTGTCTPRCCEGDDSLCESSPEGYPGVCEVQVFSPPGSGSPRVPLYHVCSYKPGCKPFRIQPCAGSDQTCLLQKDLATYRCSEILQLPAKTNGQACKYANECADGLYCLGPTDAGTCTTVCFRADGDPPPFDASAVGNEPGKGGCPGGSACTGTITGFPGYLGYCR